MMMRSKKPSFLMLLKKKSMEDHGPDRYGFDESEWDDEEDEVGGFEREGMRAAVQDFMSAVRSGEDIKAMDALETFIRLCRKG